MSDTKRNFQIGVFVTKDEYAVLKEAAGLEPLSSYCRRVLLYHKTVGAEPIKSKSRFSGLPTLGEK